MDICAGCNEGLATLSGEVDVRFVALLSPFERAQGRLYRGASGNTHAVEARFAPPRRQRQQPRGGGEFTPPRRQIKRYIYFIIFNEIILLLINSFVQAA